MPDGLIELARKRSVLWRRYLQLAGFVLTAAAIGFVVYRIATADFSELERIGIAKVISVTALTGGLYGLSGFILAWAWFSLLSAFAGRTLPRCEIISTFAITQLFKYLPSNLLHLVGRHVSTRSLGVAHSVLLAGSAAEILGLLSAAALLAVVTGSTMIVENAPRIGIDLTNPRLLLVAISLLVISGLLVWSRARKNVAITIPPVSTAVLVLLLYTVFFLNSALVLGLLSRFALSSPQPPLDLIAVAAAAWLAGFIVPGAPAGIGIREAFIIMLLESTLGPTLAVALASLYRLATFSGDLLFALLGLGLQRVYCRRSILEQSSMPRPETH